jgi:hypothetical protein
MSVTGSIMAVAGLAGAGISAHAAGKAASTQANAANYAATLQSQDAQKALDWQKQVYGTNLGLEMPWINAGTNSVNTLQRLMGMGGGTNTNSAVSPNSPFAPNAPAAMADGGFDGGGAMSPTGPGANSDRFSNAMEMRSAMNRIPSAGGVNGPRMSGPVSVNGLPNPDIGNFGTATGAQATVPATGAVPSDPNAYLQPFKNWDQTFQAPTGLTEQNDPGYKARLALGQQALENSAAAKGDLLTGGTAKDLTNYAQNFASNEYGNVYNRALGEYQQNYNIFQNQQTGQFNRLAALSGFGQTSAGQLSSAGQASANNAGNILLTSGGQIGQNINNAAAARASGYVGEANAASGAIGNLGNLALLYNIMKQGGGAPNYPPTPGG